MQWTIKKASPHAYRFITLTTIALTCSLACLTQAERRVSTLLERRLSATWQGQELGIVVDRIAEAYEIEIWLDRRVDRQRRVSIQIVDETLRQALKTISDQQTLGFAEFGSIIYLGPKASTDELATLLRQARQTTKQLPASLRKRWLRSVAVEWPRLSEPRQLITSWLDTANFQVNGAKQIAHDLWPAQALPAMPMLDRIVLVLAGFNLTCQISPDGKTCEILPIQRPLKRKRPSAQVAAVPEKTASSSHPTKRERGNSRQLLTLRLENQPLGRVLDQLGKQLRLKIDWEDSLESVSRDRLVSCDVQKVELDELLHELLSSINLQHRSQGRQITIERRP